MNARGAQMANGVYWMSSVMKIRNVLFESTHDEPGICETHSTTPRHALFFERSNDGGGTPFCFVPTQTHKIIGAS